MTKKAFTADTTAAAELLFNTPAATPATASKSKRKTAARPTAQTSEPAQTAEVAPVFSWRAKRDGEKRDYRYQIACKRSVAQKAATLARENGVSVAYLFELLVLAKWERDHGKD